MVVMSAAGTRRQLLPLLGGLGLSASHAAQYLDLQGSVACAPFTTVLELISSSWPSSAIEACDRCIAAPTTCGVVAPSWRTCPIVLPPIPSK